VPTPKSGCGFTHIFIHDIAAKRSFKRFAAKLYYTAAQGGSGGGRPAMVIMPSVSMLTTWSLEALAVSLASGSVASGLMPLQADITSLRRTCACTQPSLARTRLHKLVHACGTARYLFTAMYHGACCSTANKHCCPLAPCKQFRKTRIPDMLAAN